jgi:ABC-type Fe3+ transport system substrate-binding protein
MTVRTIVRAAIIAAASAFAASAPGAAESWAENAKVMELYAKAKAEGEVVVWGPQKDQVEWIVEAVAKHFPGIAVKWNADVRAAAKLIAEARGGRHAVDVFVNSLGGSLELQERQLLAKGQWSLFGVAKDSIFLDGQAAATHNIVWCIAYNAALVKPEALPTTWAEMVDPKYKGKFLASAFLLPRLGGFLAMEWGIERTEEWMRKLVQSQDLLLTLAPRDGILKSGERAITITEFTSLVQRYAESGVDAKYKTLDIVPATQFLVSPIAKAPHPNAAQLVSGFLTTEEARQFRERASFDVDVRPSSNSKLAMELRASGGKLIVEDPSNMEQRAEFYKRLSPLVTGRTQ